MWQRPDAWMPGIRGKGRQREEEIDHKKMVSMPVGPFTNMPGDVLPEYTKTHRIMKDTVQFGFHPVGGRNAHFSRDLLVAGCCNHGGHAVCYGARPFQGRSEMEIQLIGVPYNDSISSHEREILLGLLKRPKGRGHIDSHNDVPRCSQDKPDTHFIVYQGYEVWDKRDPKDVKQKKYGYRTTLRFLRKNEKVGMKVTEDGDLYFYYDGVCQGLAASNVYLDGYDIYPFFELRGHVHVALITKALVSQEEVTLQQLCIQSISRSITKSEDAKELPLPEKFQEAVRENHSQVYTGCVPERYEKVWKFLFEDKRYKKHTHNRFTDFFKFCLADKRRSEDPQFLERMQRRRQEDRERGGKRSSRKRERDYFYDDFMFEDFPWKDKKFWS